MSAQLRQERTPSVDELISLIKERDLRIAELECAAAELQSSRRAIRFAATMVMAAVKMQAVSLLKPQLGVLRQYPPRPLQVPNTEKLPVPPDAPQKISIVTPSFNQAMYLERTIRSVIEQNYANFEYIVQDGGSSDGSTEIIKKYGDSLKHWESARDGGQQYGINLGFRHATGEIMAYLNSDDFLFPGTLAYVAEFFCRHPEVDVVYGHRIIVDEEDREIGRWVMPLHDDAVLSWADYVPQETLFWRRPIWERAGAKLDESFRFALDWELQLRFRDAGARFR